MVCAWVAGGRLAVAQSCADTCPSANNGVCEERRLHAPCDNNQEGCTCAPLTDASDCMALRACDLVVNAQCLDDPRGLLDGSDSCESLARGRRCATPASHFTTIQSGLPDHGTVAELCPVSCQACVLFDPASGDWPARNPTGAEVEVARVGDVSAGYGGSNALHPSLAWITVGAATGDGGGDQDGQHVAAPRSIVIQGHIPRLRVVTSPQPGGYVGCFRNMPQWSGVLRAGFSHATAGVPSDFLVVVYDQYGNPLDNLDGVYVRTANPMASNTTSSHGLTRDHDVLGQHNGAYMLTASGTYSFDIFVETYAGVVHLDTTRNSLVIQAGPLDRPGLTCYAENSNRSTTNAVTALKQVYDHWTEPEFTEREFREDIGGERDGDHRSIGCGRSWVHTGFCEWDVQFGLVCDIQSMDQYQNPRMLDDAYIIVDLERERDTRGTVEVITELNAGDLYTPTTIQDATIRCSAAAARGGSWRTSLLGDRRCTRGFFAHYTDLGVYKLQMWYARNESGAYNQYESRWRTEHFRLHVAAKDVYNHVFPAYPASSGQLGNDTVYTAIDVVGDGHHDNWWYNPARSSAAHSGLVCLNNMLDDTACRMCTGKAGEQSSFTITSRNELEVPNFRGGDLFRVELRPALEMASVLGCLGARDQQACVDDHNIIQDASYLRIQFYTVAYTPVVAGSYQMAVTMLDSDTLQWIPVGTSIAWEGSCTFSGSTVAVEVKPGNPYPGYTTYFASTTMVPGDTVPVVVTVKDLYNNSVTPDVLMETQSRFNVRMTMAGASAEFLAVYQGQAISPGVYGDRNKGEYVSMVRMESGMGRAHLSVLVQTPCVDNCRGLVWHDAHVHASPTSVVLVAAAFSPVDTSITNYVHSATAATALSFALQTQDRFGNTVPETGLTVVLDWLSSGAGGVFPVETRAVSDLGGGAYRLDFSAEQAGAYTFRISVNRLTENRTALANPWVDWVEAGLTEASVIFDYLVLPGPATRGLASGPGILGAVAGIETMFAITLQDQFGNVRDDVDLLNVLFVDARATNASAPLDQVAVGIAGGVMRPGWSLLPQDPANPLGRFDGRYVLTQAGRYRLYFFVTGNPLAGREDWSAAERLQPAIDGVEIAVSQSGGTALGAFSVVAGSLARPSLSFPTGNLASGIVVGSAGLGMTFEVQLLDLYENPRLLDDAVLRFTIKRSAGASYVQLQPSEIDYLNYVYIADGMYTATVQLNTAARYRLFVQVQDAADDTAPLFLPLDVQDDGATVDPFVTCSNNECYSQMTAHAGFAAVSRCVAGNDGIVTTLATSAIEEDFPITLFDRFGNINTQQGALPPGDPNYLTVTVELEGGVNPADGSSTTLVHATRVVPGVVTWSPLEGRFVARYTVIFAGTYQMLISINGQLLRAVTITAVAGLISPAETTASGVGLLRTEPMSSALDRWRESPWTSSLVAIRVRDANRVAVNDLYPFIPLFSVEITDPDSPGVPLPCPLSVSFTNEGHGYLALDYFLSYDFGYDALPGVDESDSGSGGQMCGGLTVDYDTQPYAIGVLFNGQHIDGSPFTVRVGRYKPPNHNAYVTSCSSACNSITPTALDLRADPPVSYFDCSQFDNSCSAGPSSQMYIIPDTSFAAGTPNNVWFQNVYRTGFPGCVVLECEEQVDDYSAEQTDQTTNARADFSAEIVDRNTGSAVDVGPRWFDAAQLANPTNGLYTFQYNINVAGEYTVSITAGDGTPIRMGERSWIDCAFNVTVTPTIADALSTMLTGASQATQVEAFSTITAVTSDRYGNVRGRWQQMDTITMDFSAASSTSGPTPTVDFDQTTSTYTISYTVHQCDGSAGFMIRCNGVAVRVMDFSVPCRAGAMAAMTEAVSDPNGAGRSDIAVASTLVAGSTELIKLQARDQYGNIKREGGEAPRFAAQHVEAQGPDGQAAQTLSLSSRIQDNSDGTYYLSFDVRFVGLSTVAASVNSQSIANSPYYAQVVAAALFPGTTDAQVPSETGVGTSFSLAISQRDTFRNAVTQAPDGAYTAYMEGQMFTASVADKLRVDMLWTVSGDKSIEVFYRDAAGSVTSVDAINAGTYSVYISPGPAVIHSTEIAADNHYSRYADSFQRTQDCVSNQQSVIVIQTKDAYQNNCDERVANANLFDGMVQECLDGVQACATAGGNVYQATFAYACPDENDATGCVKGAYTISYTVLGTGWHKLELRYGVSDPIIGAPFVILSDTAAVPGLCIASGPGLQTSVAGNPAQFQITARGGSANNIQARMGAGDNFVVETDAGAQTQDKGREYLGGGVYRCTLTATSWNHTSPTWQYQVSIKLLDNADPRTLQHIGGSPFTVTMGPGQTAALYSVAQPEGPPPAVRGLSTSSSGATAQLHVRAMDAYNNEVYGCVTGFAVRVQFTAANFFAINASDRPTSDKCSFPNGTAGYMRYAYNGFVQNDTCTAIADIQAGQSGCQSAEYVFDYMPQTAGRYEVFITFAGALIQNSGSVCGVPGDCTDNPWHMQVSSAGISAQQSFVSTQATNDAQPAQSGDFNVTIAGRSMFQYVHAYDQYHNRLTQPACSSGSTNCIQAILYWCQVSTNMTELTAGRTDHFTMSTRSTEGTSSCERPENILDRSDLNPVSVTVADTDASGGPIQDGVYAVDSLPTRSGTILLAINVDEGSGVVPYPVADRLFRQVDTDVAVPDHTVATPADRSVADEQIDFVIRPHDQFGNFVDDDSLEFTIEIIILSDNPGAYANTTVEYNPPDGTYTGTYKVNTYDVRIGLATYSALIRLFVLLDNVQTNQAGHSIRLRAATNKPRFCYVLSRDRGPQNDRWHDFSTDLLNEDSKVVGQNLTITVQSMTLQGPRTIDPESVCNTTQILMDGITCERLDEFQIETSTISRGQRVTVTGFGESCRQTPECYGEQGSETECNPDDCSRRGWYEVKWQATISGMYEISVSSRGAAIQQPPRAAFQEQFQPGHDFGPAQPSLSPYAQYSTFSVVVYPSAMSAVTSTVSVEALHLGEKSHVNIVGRDGYGNRLLENLGESPAMGVRLKTACQAADAFDTRFSEDFSVDYKDDQAEPGTFTSTVKPAYGGPTEVEVYLHMACFEGMTRRVAHELIPHQVDLRVHPSGCNPFAGQLVGGTSYGQIATLGISVVLPNAGDIGGATQVAVPIHGLCEYYDNWNSTFLCNWKTRTSGGQIQQQSRVARLDEAADPLLTVEFNIYGATHEVRWYVEQRLGSTVIQGHYVDGTAGTGSFPYMPPAGAAPRGVCTDVVDPSAFDPTLPTTCTDLVVAQPCAAWIQGFTCAGASVADICCESCRAIAAQESVINQMYNVQEKWQLPGSPEIAMWLVVETPWGAPLNFTLVDDMDRTVMEQDLPYRVLTSTGDGTYCGDTLHEWRLSLSAPTKVHCDPAPSTADISGVTLAHSQEVEFSIEVTFEGGSGPFLAIDGRRTTNVRPYFYYPPPVLTHLVPQAEVLRGSGQVHAPISGGMPLIIQGTGFNIGDGAQKDKFLCIFSDRDCSLVNGVGQCANSEPRFDHRNCSTNILTGELVCVQRAGLFVSRATYVDDGSLYCTCPAVDASILLSLEISTNSQEVAPTQLSLGYYGRDVETIAEPAFSDIGGGGLIGLTLVSGPSTGDGYCRFSDFSDVVAAVRINARTLVCIAPAASADTVTVNGWTAVRLTFDNATWTHPAFMVYNTSYVDLTDLGNVTTRSHSSGKAGSDWFSTFGQFDLTGILGRVNSRPSDLCVPSSANYGCEYESQAHLSREDAVSDCTIMCEGSMFMSIRNAASQDTVQCLCGNEFGHAGPALSEDLCGVNGTTCYIGRCEDSHAVYRMPITSISPAGGRLVVQGGGSARVRTVSFVGLSAPNGGAIEVINASLSLEHVALRRNAAVYLGVTATGNVLSGNGGALRGYCSSADCDLRDPIVLNHVIFEDNVAERGGAIWLQDVSFVAQQTMFVNNTALSVGGAVYVEGIEHSIVHYLQMVQFQSNESPQAAVYARHTNLTLVDVSFRSSAIVACTNRQCDVDVTAQPSAIASRDILGADLWSVKFQNLTAEQSAVTIQNHGKCVERPCSPGFWCTNTGNISTCISCMVYPGTIGEDGISCRPCTSGTGPSPDGLSCEPCQAGYYSNCDTSSVCTRCLDEMNEAQTSCSTDTVFRCAAGSMCPVAMWCRSQLACDDCPSGQYSVKGGECTPCDQTRGLVANEAQSACSLCMPGFGPNVNGDGCTRCGPRQHSNNATSHNCRDCEFPNVVGSDGTQCSRCLPGSGPTPPDHTNCSRCTGREFSTGADECITCPGDAVPIDNNSGCIACELHQVAVDNRCLCAPGYYNSSQGTLKCGSECQRDKDKATAQTKFGCEPCPHCTRCPVGMDGKSSVPLLEPGYGLLKAWHGRSLHTIRSGGSSPTDITLYSCPLPGMCIGDHFVLPSAWINSSNLKDLLTPETPGVTSSVSVASAIARMRASNLLQAAHLDVEPDLPVEAALERLKDYYLIDAPEQVPVFDAVLSSTVVPEFARNKHSWSKMYQTTSFDCRVGHAVESPLCALCQQEGPQFVGGSTGMCVDCTVAYLHWVKLLLGLLCAAVGYMLAAHLTTRLSTMHTTTLQQRRDKRGYIHVVERESSNSADVVHGKIMVSHFQILMQIHMVMDVPFPPNFQRLLDFVRILKGELIEYLNIKCAIHMNMYSEFTVAMLVLPVALTVGCIASKYRGSNIAARNMLMSRMFVLVFFIYPFLTTRIFHMFSCKYYTSKGSGDESWHRYDYNIDCLHDNLYRDFEKAAGCMVLLYPIGIPAFTLWILRKNSDRLKHTSQTQHSAYTGVTGQQTALPWWHGDRTTFLFMVRDYKPGESICGPMFVLFHLVCVV